MSPSQRFGPQLQVGERFLMPQGWPQKPLGGPLAEWRVVRVTPTNAYAREAYRSPRRVEIKNALGEVVRSFMVTEGGKVEVLSLHASVQRVREGEE